MLFLKLQVHRLLAASGTCKTVKESPHSFSSTVGLYIIVVTYCAENPSASNTGKERDWIDYLAFVPCGDTGSKDIVLDATRRKMVEYGMIRHIEHAVVILHRCRTIQDGFSEKERQAWWGSELCDTSGRTLILLRLFWAVKVKKVSRHIIAPEYWLRGFLALERLRLPNGVGRVVFGLGAWR